MKTYNTITNGNGAHTEKFSDIGDLPPLQEKERTVKKETPLSESQSYERLTPAEVYLRSSAYKDGYDLALKSNDFRVNADSENHLRRKWQKVAKESDQGIFDPSANLHDRHYQQEFERKQNIRQDTEDALHNAEINLREKEEALAQTPKPTETSDAAVWVLFAVAVAVFSIGFAPTFHDVFFIALSQADPLVGWLASIAVSLPIGAILALLILIEFGRNIASFNWLGLAAGILVALGFLLIRYSAAGDLDALSVGLFIYECALVLGMEAVSFFRRKATKEARQQTEIYEKAEKDLAVAVKQKDRSREEYEKFDRAIETHIEFIENRRTGTLFNPAIEEALDSAAVSGYRAGVRDMHARKIGKRG